MAKAPAAKTASKKIPNAPTASKEDLLRFYREMVLIRRFEERAGRAVSGFDHRGRVGFSLGESGENAARECVASAGRVDGVGRYQMLGDDGHAFEAPVPAFALSIPRVLH